MTSGSRGRGVSLAFVRLQENSFRIDDRPFVQQQIGEDRRPDETQIMSPDVRRRLSGPLDGYVAANAIQFAIGLVNRMRIQAIAAHGHGVRQHAVGKCDHVDTKEFRSAPNLTYF